MDAPYTTAQTITVTLSGAPASDFEVTVGSIIESLNANGAFTVALAAGETGVTFGLVDITPDDGSSDIAAGATLQLSASLPNPDTAVGGTIQSASLTFNYIPEGADTAPAPKPSNVITGTYNSNTGITTYSGDNGDDIITGTGTANLINAQNSGNDSITGGSGTNTITGSSGNSVFVLSGTFDTVALGGGYNTAAAAATPSMPGMEETVEPPPPCLPLRRMRLQIQPSMAAWASMFWRAAREIQ